MGGTGVGVGVRAWECAGAPYRTVPPDCAPDRTVPPDCALSRTFPLFSPRPSPLGSCLYIPTYTSMMQAQAANEAAMAKHFSQLAARQALHAAEEAEEFSSMVSEAQRVGIPRNP